MRLVLTAAEVKVVKEFGFDAYEINTKVGHKKVLPNGEFEVEIKSEFIFDLIAIFTRVKPTCMAIVTMIKSLGNQFEDLGKTFSDKWFK